MAARQKGAARVIALAGPSGAGKTTLAQALRKTAETFEQPGKQAGVIEMRQAGPSAELSALALDFMGETFSILDLPGSLEFIAEMDHALPAADLALVVADPDPNKAHLLQPYLRELERLGVPRAIFINKIDTAYSNVNQMLEALQPFSAAALVARQIPLFKGEVPAGFTDLNQSPFNVGTRLTLADFTLAQIAELNRRYGGPLTGEEALARLLQALGCLLDVLLSTPSEPIQDHVHLPPCWPAATPSPSPLPKPCSRAGCWRRPESHRPKAR